MNDFERYFVDTMTQASNRGLSFRMLAERGAKERLGEVPGDIFLRSLSKAARLDPRYFVGETSKLFGAGAKKIYDSVLEQAIVGNTPHEPTVYEATVQELITSVHQGPSTNASGALTGGFSLKIGQLLHVFRVKDEEGNFPDNAG